MGNRILGGGPGRFLRRLFRCSLYLEIATHIQRHAPLVLGAAVVSASAHVPKAMYKAAVQGPGVQR
jgi:hypothetical protein